jgi:hypothetical protein
MAYEYYFAITTDDDKGVPFGPVNKDNLDVARLIIDFSCWLDTNESITEISYMAIRANSMASSSISWRANYPINCADYSTSVPTVDSYPLIFVDHSVIHEGRAVVVDVAAGTPLYNYVVSFTATAGLSRRRRLVDILMTIDQPINPDMVAVGGPVPVYYYPLIVHTSTIFPADFKGRVYVDNTTGGPITMTLPLSPTAGDEVCFLDIAGNFDEFPVTFIGAPGSTTFEDGGTSITAKSQHEDICFEWTGAYWNINVVDSGDNAGDCVNVMDFGAVMDGVTSDVAAFQKAFDAAPAFSTVCVPAGHVHIDGFEPTSKFVHFKLDGTYNGTSTIPFTQIGTSVVSTFLENGTVFYSKATKGAVAFGPTFRVDQVLDHTGGPSGGVQALGANIWIKDTYDGAMVPIGLAVQSTDERTSQSYPESIGLLATGARNNSGVGANVFGANVIVDDRSMAPSSESGSAVGQEITLKANKLDDGLLADGFNVNEPSSGLIEGANRIGLDIKYTRSNLGDGTPVDWSNFLNIAPSNVTEPGLSGKNFIMLAGHSTYSAINMRHMVTDKHCLLMKSGMTVTWTPTESNNQPTYWSYLSHEPGVNSRLRFVSVTPSVTTECFSVSDTGQVAFTLPVDAANDAAAAGAGVPIGGMYRNGSVLMVRAA